MKSIQKKTSGGSPQSASKQDQSNDQDAIAMLKSDHRKVEQLFQKFETSQDQATKEQVAGEVCLELIIHTKLEEEIFYPSCREAGVEDEALNEAQVEHDSAKVFIADVINGSPSEEFYNAKVCVLSEYIKHHVGEEEKPSDGIFAKAQKAGMDMKALGVRLQARKAELMAKSEALKSQPPMPRSLHLQTLKETSMPRYRDRDDDDERRSSRSGGRERDESGRFMSDDDEGYSRGRSSRSGGRERDESGRFMSDDDEGYSRGRSSRSGGRERDESGRFMSDDDEGYSRGQSSRGGGRYRDDDDDDRRSSRNEGRGWYGDPEGHSEASRRGREERGGGQSQSRYQGDDDDRRGESRGRGRGQGGWFGDPEGHSEASQRGWEERGGSRSRSRDEDDNDRRSSRSSRSGGRGEGQGGWFGDPEGHSEASRRGWRNR